MDYVDLIMRTYIAINEEARRSGKEVGIKPSGGIKTADDALLFHALVEGILGPDWLSPSRFRFGASSVLKAIIAEIEKLETSNA